jgi:hypothetical protein
MRPARCGPLRRSAAGQLQAGGKVARSGRGVERGGG